MRTAKSHAGRSRSGVHGDLEFADDFTAIATAQSLPEPEVDVLTDESTRPIAQQCDDSADVSTSRGRVASVVAIVSAVELF